MVKIEITTTYYGLIDLYKWLDDFAPDWQHHSHNAGPTYRSRPSHRRIRSHNEEFIRIREKQGKSDQVTRLAINTSNKSAAMLAKLTWQDVVVEDLP